MVAYYALPSVFAIGFWIIGKVIVVGVFWETVITIFFWYVDLVFSVGVRL